MPPDIRGKKEIYDVPIKLALMAYTGIELSGI
jgi:hypothetical protein